MALSTATAIPVAGKQFLGLCRRGSIARTDLPWCRVSTHTTLLCPQPRLRWQTHRQPSGGNHYSTFIPKPQYRLRKRMAAQNTAPLVWIDCEVKTFKPIVHCSWLMSRVAMFLAASKLKKANR